VALEQRAGWRCGWTTSLRIPFHRSLIPDEYAVAVLACQLAMTMIGMNDVATVRPDGTATDDQINDMADSWMAGNPWVADE
jgi:hypothetical protein